MLVARGDAPEVFDLQEEPFDEIAFAVECEVARDLWRGFSGRDDRDGVLFGDGIAERLGIVALVAENVSGRQIGDQGFGLGDVVDLTWRENESEGIAQGIDDGVYFCSQSATRTTDRASFRPPFLPAAC